MMKAGKAAACSKNPKDAFDELVALTKKSIEFDPWSKKRGLGGYCEEIWIEADEVMDAVRNRDYENLKSELGDVLLDWCHACELAEMEGRFTAEEVISGVIQKIGRRKPYLKENRKVGPEEASRIWKEAKEKEKKDIKKEK
jgi:tetrapyrrole methylase family protein / MazG family protein